MTSERAPRTRLPLSQATTFGDLVFVSGQVGIDPTTGDVVPGGFEAQTRQTLENVRNILEAAGSDTSKVLKTTCYLADIGDFDAFNSIYGEYFGDRSPARTTVPIARLARGFLVEVEAFAHR